jgi:hypothetical protein
MLALKQDLSLVSLKRLAWVPNDESTLVAWYKNRTGVTTVGTGLAPNVSAWADSSINNHDMTQSTSANQPTYTSSGGHLTFDNSAPSYLQTTSQISLTGDFTIGFRLDTDTDNGTILGDNTASGEFIKFSTASQIRIKIDGSDKNITLDSGTFGDSSIILTRVSDVITLYLEGTAQSTTPTLAGTADIDAIGIREASVNAYNGTMQEIQIYSSSSADLTTKVNDRLTSL